MTAAPVNMTATTWDELSPALQNVVIAAVACYAVLVVTALTIWFRRPPSGGYPPWARYMWLAVILLGNTLGCLVFLLVRPWRAAGPLGGEGPGEGHGPAGGGHGLAGGGRNPAGGGHGLAGGGRNPAGDDHDRPGTEHSRPATDIVDLLYGENEQ